MRDGLNKTGRPILFSLCGWNNWYAPVGQELGNSWRIGPDDTSWYASLLCFVITTCSIGVPHVNKDLRSMAVVSKHCRFEVAMAISSASLPFKPLPFGVACTVGAS